MEPNPNQFPILSYIIYPHLELHEELKKKMPKLTNPKLQTSMKQSISRVTQTQSILQTIGPRPNQESVNTARARISEIESGLSKELQEIVLSPRPVGLKRSEWRENQAVKEREWRKWADKEMGVYKSAVQLDEGYRVYEKLLGDSEERLSRVYKSFEDFGDEGLEEEENGEYSGVGFLLERVELSKRELEFLPDAFGRLSGLIVLDLSNNRLEVIPESIGGLKSVQELDVSCNRLVSLPESIGCLSNLKILDVSLNHLKALPDNISHCRSLVELQAGYNQLVSLPTNIGYELVNLQKLSVHHNELCCIPYTIGRLTNLEILNLSKNFSDLKELPDTIGDLTNLRELDLNNNQIRALPVTFSRLNRLTKLNLEQNPLVIPPLEIVNKGVEAVMEFMVKRWLDVQRGEHDRNRLAEVEEQTQTGWRTRLRKWGSVITERVSGYVRAEGKDSYLNKQL